MRRIILAAILLVAVQGAARADAGGSTLVVPIDDPTGAASEALRARLGEIVLTSLEQRGVQPKRAKVGLHDILAMGGCSLEDRSCLRRLPKALDVDALVLSWIERAKGGGLALTIARVGRGGVKQKRHLLEAQDDEGRAGVLARALGVEDGDRGEGPARSAADRGEQGRAGGEAGGRGAPDPEEAPGGAEEPPAEEAEAPQPPAPKPAPPAPASETEEPDGDPLTATPAPRDDGGFSLGRARGYAWAITGAGAALALGSLVPYLLAEDKQGQIDAFGEPRTDQDFRDLVDLEDDARARYRLGHAMLIGGAALSVTGAALVFYQAQSDESSERPKLTVSPAPRGDGFVFTLFGAR